MLRIHLEAKCESVTIRVEGRIAGDWVDELEKCCREVLARQQNRRVIIELDEVIIVDARGEALLQHMHQAGVALTGRGMHSQDLVERIQQRQAG